MKRVEQSIILISLCMYIAQASHDCHEPVTDECPGPHVGDACGAAPVHLGSVFCRGLASEAGTLQWHV